MRLQDLSLDSWLALLLIAAPFVARKALQLYRQLRTPRPLAPVAREARWPATLRLALLLGTLSYCAPKLLVGTPRSLFDQLGLSFAEPNSRLYQAVMASDRPFASDIALLAHLKTFEGRITYMAVGQAPLLLCDACSSRTDFKAFVLPSLLRHYAGLAVVLGLLACGRGREVWRTWCSMAVLASFGAELYVLAQDWDKQTFIPFYTHLARQSACATLSLATYLLPAQPEPISISLALGPLLASTGQLLQTSSETLSFGHHLRATMLRYPMLRSSVLSFWDQEVAQADMAKSMPEIRRLFKEAGLERTSIKAEEDAGTRTVVEGSERQGARAYVRQQLAGLTGQPDVAS